MSSPRYGVVYLDKPLALLTRETYHRLTADKAVWSLAASRLKRHDSEDFLCNSSNSPRRDPMEMAHNKRFINLLLFANCKDEPV